ncbi:MAG: GNAT family N-acetyltransferase [Alphaproteobacteria bacterium]|nr:GNAT family N-acetyltransferase [Alphaproteobacteria bacterium]
MTVTVQPVTATDAGWLAALHARCFPEDSWREASWRNLLRQPGVGGAVASVDGVPVGVVLWRRAAEEAEILTIGVVPTERRRGVGGRLLDHALSALPRVVAAVFLEVAADNEAARRFYTGRGFTRIGRRAGYYRRGRVSVDALLMRVDRDTG